MALNTNKNTGLNKTLTIYVDDASLGRDFKLITKFKFNPTFTEGEDKYMGVGDNVPWQQIEMYEGSFSMEEQSAQVTVAFESAVIAAATAGVRANIYFVEETQNGDGTSTRVKYSKSTLKPARDNPGKDQKTTIDWSVRCGARDVLT